MKVIGIKTLESNGLPDSENCVAVRSLVLTQYRRVTYGQTDRQAAHVYVKI